MFASVTEACEQARVRPQWAVIGVTTTGGRFTEPLKAVLLETVQARVGLVNGLHEPLSELPELCKLAEAKGEPVSSIQQRLGAALAQDAAING